jgi:heat shock protein HspQ
MENSKPKYCIGQLINHKLFKYRGIVLWVDPCFRGTEEWYQTVARSCPPKDKPWYHVKGHDNRRTYVAECNLEPDLTYLN